MPEPINLTAGPVTEVVFLDPDRPHTKPDERGCPDCGEEAYFSGCEADGCNSWGCPDCGTGCDRDFVDADEGGRCASYADEDDEDDEDED
ncbi:hypothetical protein [Streptomyces griseosporeus]|uniref:hypothetical protein n=1 Tax=Streptomyces griseosporeus TaxID=1910 RepID=UPI0036FC59B8